MKLENDLVSKIGRNMENVYSTTDPRHIRRPLSAYHHFYRHHKQFFFKYNTSDSNNLTLTKNTLQNNDGIPLTKNQIRKYISKMWKSASKETRKKFKSVSKQEKRRFRSYVRNLPPCAYVDHAKECYDVAKLQTAKLKEDRAHQNLDTKVKGAMQHQSKLAVEFLREERSTKGSPQNDYFIDALGVKWSLEEQEILKEMSTYLNSLSDESFMQNVFHSAAL